MIGFRLLHLAEDEMLDASSFYEGASPGLGDDFLDDVQYAIDRVRENPTAGLAIDTDLRRVLFRRFPFSLIYSTDLSTVVVVAIAHQRRRPNYWRRRRDR